MFKKITSHLPTNSSSSNVKEDANVDVFASKDPFDKVEKTQDDEKEKVKESQANNELLLAIQVTKLRMSEWGLKGKITASIHLGVVTLSMSLAKEKVTGTVEALSQELDTLAEQVSAEHADESFESENAKDDEEDAKKFGSFLKNKLSEAVDGMLKSIRATGLKMKKSGLTGTVGASIDLKFFGFGITVGVEVELSDMETELEDVIRKPGSGTLIIHVLEGRKLESKTGNVDAFMNFRTGYQFKKTKVISKNASPVWNEVLKMEANLNEGLRVRVWSQNLLGKNHLIAEQWYDLKKLELYTGEPKEIVLKDKSGNGEVVFKIGFRFFDTKINRELQQKMIKAKEAKNEPAETKHT